MNGKFLIFILFLWPAILTSQPFQIDRQDGGYLLTEAGKAVLFYQQETQSHTETGTYPRANYIHPLYGPDGAILTEDFPPDHLHQRGVFWTWHQVWVGERPIAHDCILEVPPLAEQQR